jgi:RND family efflux transporter MFP subunit
MKRYQKVAAFVGLGLLAVSGAAAVSHGVGQSQPKDSRDAPGVPRVVRVRTVKEGPAAGEQAYTGVVRARCESDLAFRVGGKVVARLIEIGDRVRPGQVLLQLDPRDYELAVKVAEAELTTADAEFKQATAEEGRTRRAVASEASSATEYDKARAARDMAAGRQVRAARALELARNRLGYCTLTADAAGVVIALPAEVGQVVAEGQVVTRVARAGEKEAVVSIPENRVSCTKAGSARVTFWSEPGKSYPVTLRELSPVADPVTRTFQARFTLPTGVSGVELGMTATVHVTLTDAPAGYALPRTCLTRTGDRPAVWVVERASGRLTLVPVRVVRYGQDAVVLADGVKPGDLVVTAGVQKLDPGCLVRPLEETR